MEKYTKIAIILPKGKPFRFSEGKLNVFPLSTVPLTIPVLVSLIPKELDIQLQVYDESIEVIKKEEIRADLIVISAITPTVNRAYAYADYFRRKGIKVVLGGVHPTFNPEEALQHADSVMKGIALESFPQLLKDFRKNKLQKIYEQRKAIDLSGMPIPDRECYKNKSIARVKINGIQATYGCTNTCEFCVQPYVCGGYHQRPIRDVVDEIKTIKSGIIEFYDPNLTDDREYLEQLCKALIPLKKKWAAPATIEIAEDKELLRLLYKSGCRSLLIGFESVNQQNLKKISKNFNRVEEYKRAVDSFHKAGIAVTGSFVFGLDSDTKEIFKQTFDFVNQAHIDIPRFTINTPFPGTPFYERMKREGRIIENDWSMYDCCHAIIKPKNMTIKELQEGFSWLSKESYKLGAILKRVKFINLFSIMVFMANIGYKIRGEVISKLTREDICNNHL